MNNISKTIATILLVGTLSNCANLPIQLNISQSKRFLNIPSKNEYDISIKTSAKNENIEAGAISIAQIKLDKDYVNLNGMNIDFFLSLEKKNYEIYLHRLKTIPITNNNYLIYDNIFKREVPIRNNFGLELKIKLK